MYMIIASLVCVSETRFQGLGNTPHRSPISHIYVVSSSSQVLFSGKWPAPPPPPLRFPPPPHIAFSSTQIPIQILINSEALILEWVEVNASKMIKLGTSTH